MHLLGEGAILPPGAMDQMAPPEIGGLRRLPILLRFSHSLQTLTISTHNERNPRTTQDFYQTGIPDKLFPDQSTRL